MAESVYMYCVRCQRGRDHAMDGPWAICTACGLKSGGIVRRKRLTAVAQAKES